MADPNQSSYDSGNGPSGGDRQGQFPQTLNTRQIGEPDSLRYRMTPGVARALRRPGGIEGSTSGSGGDPGRTGLASLGDAEDRIPSHTGV